MESSSFNLFEVNDIKDIRKKGIKSTSDFKQNYQKNQEFDSNELFVFGYQCKLFRDDEMALKLESEANLIPWNGDSSLLIDRYDGRGYLFDLKAHDSENSKNNIKSENISQEEIDIEKLCDEERYGDLNKQVELDSIYQEEEMKRFYSEQNQYGAVSLNYVQGFQQSSVIEDKSDGKEEKGSKTVLEVFVPSEKLKLPIGMLIPETRKHNAIIEKTASFVATKGLQMEILIKAKQSSNSLFSFLNYDDCLNPYYKHLVEIIKNGKYISSVDESEDSESDEDDGDGSYLHPLLSKNMENSKNTNFEELPKDLHQFKPNIKDSPYTTLIEKFTSHLAKQKENLMNEKPSITIKNDSSTQEEMQIPNEDLKNMIDKLADYVVRNGPEFEECIKLKNDERFNFLNQEHEYHKYYELKIQQYKELQNRDKCFDHAKSISQNRSNNNDSSMLKNKIDLKENQTSCIFGDQYVLSKTDPEGDSEDGTKSPLNTERFTNEQKATRKLKAALFLNMLSTSKNNESLNKDQKWNSSNNFLINSDEKLRVSRLDRKRSISDSSIKRSRSTSSSKLRKSNQNSSQRKRKTHYRHRSRSRSKRSKYKHRSRSISSRTRHRNRKESRYHRSRSNSRHRNSKHKSHKKSRRTRKKIHGRSRSNSHSSNEYTDKYSIREKGNDARSSSKTP